MSTSVIGQGFSVMVSPEIAAILTSALVTSIGMYITLVKWLPSFLQHREDLWEKRQQSQLADDADRRQEDIDQRLLLKTSTEAQIRVSEAQLALLTQLIETNAKNASTQESTSKELAIIGQASRATERALTENTVGLSQNTQSMAQLNQHFDTLLTEGSEPLQAVKETQLEVKDAVDRIEKLAAEIRTYLLELPDNVVKTLIPALQTSVHEMALAEAQARTSVEEKRKTDSRPIASVPVEASGVSE